MRARRLYLRARDYGLRGLDAGHPGTSHALSTDLAKALEKTTKADIPLLYESGDDWRLESIKLVEAFR